VADFILIMLGALAVAVLGFGVFSFIVGRDPGLSQPEPDSVAGALPTDRPLIADDVEHASFDVVLRGYRMDQVDALLAAAADSIRQWEERVEALEDEAAELRSVRDGEPT
jgi:DivIVA domain-containing protein